jgi:hypothetical protein
VGCGFSKARTSSEVLVSHGNARTTVHGRMLIVARHGADWRHAHIAAATGISRKCVRTWISRHAPRGRPGWSIGPDARTPARPAPRPRWRTHRGGAYP